MIYFEQKIKNVWRFIGDNTKLNDGYKIRIYKPKTLFNKPKKNKQKNIIDLIKSL